METVYLDHSATTPVHPEVIRKMAKLMEKVYGNPSSIHQLGREAQGLLEESRQTIAKSIGAKEQEIVFTSGGTESDNTAIIQTAFTKKSEGKHIITTAVEHPAVLNAMNFLVDQGYDITFLGVDENGQLSLDEFEKSLRSDTILVSIMSTNNETGVRFPINEIGERLVEHPACFHTDAVQAYGIETINVEALHVDLLTITAHKINGPKGVGVLYIREGIKLFPLFHGGEQENKRRGGTENTIGIAGMAQAVTVLTDKEKIIRQEEYLGFKKQIIEKLEENHLSYVINGGLKNTSPHVMNLWLKGVPNDLLLMHLDLKGIAISTGSACTAGNVDPSHVLEAMYGSGHKCLKESIRISFGYQVRSEQIVYFTETLIEVAKLLKKQNDY